MIKIPAQIASTNSDSRKTDSAGVDSGLKMEGICEPGRIAHGPGSENQCARDTAGYLPQNRAFRAAARPSATNVLAVPCHCGNRGPGPRNCER